MSIDNFFKDLLQLFLTYKEVNLKKQFVSRYASVYKSKVLWKDLVEQETSQCGMNITADDSAIRHCLMCADNDLGLKCDDFVLVCKDCLVDTLEELAFTLVSRSLLSQVVDTKDHIL